mmetsp:Transcript_15370/g.20023  ORF Transcript_15370/g.20023 Transcript_15370/m.20023 type:complete len:413 (+) Transcript_15370:286-1524(+)
MRQFTSSTTTTRFTRRRKHMLCTSAVLGMMFTSASAFLLNRQLEMQLQQHPKERMLVGTSRLQASLDENKSKTASSSGVRSRVRKVLAKASVRTGIQNNSSSSVTSKYSLDDANVKESARKIADSYERIGNRSRNQSEINVMAEAASIGADAIGSGQQQQEAANGGEEENKETMVQSALRSDTAAAFNCIPAEPLPFVIPELTEEQLDVVRSGERLQEQSRMGREGNGFVVVDVNAPEDVVWACLLDFYSYPDIIPTVRDITMYTNTHLDQNYMAEKPVEYEDGTSAVLKVGVPSVTRASFTLSKFKLKIAAIHKYRPHPQGDYMKFNLDPAMTNFVLKSAEGVWHTQANPDGKEGYTRVWLLCEVKISSLLPQFITDYAASRAMPRATTWLKPQVEAAASLWLKKPPPSNN